MIKNIFRILVLQYLILIFPVLCFAARIERADKVNITVKANITFDETSHDYTYNYTVNLHGDSEQNLASIIIEYDGVDPQVLTPDGWWTFFSRRSGTFGGEPYTTERRTPNNRVEVSWSGKPGIVLRPGNTLSGMVMKSTSLPMIVTYYAIGDAPPPKSDNYEEAMALKPLMDEALARGDEEEFNRLERQSISLEDEEVENPELEGIYVNSKKGKTLGPVPPPIDFTPLSFIEKIIAYKEEARQLGWLDDPQVITSISQKLSNARDMIYNDKPSAVNLLNALLNELDAQRGQHVNDEAYFLLKYNIKYLLERM